MPFIDPTGANPGWSILPQPELGLTDFVEDMPVTSHDVPQSVTAAQGGIALIRAGLMDAVEEVASDASTPAEIVWAFRRSMTWERESPSLAYLANKAGITSDQMDALFKDAATIAA